MVCFCRFSVETTYKYLHGVFYSKHTHLLLWYYRNELLFYREERFRWHAFFASPSKRHEGISTGFLQQTHALTTYACQIGRSHGE